MLVTGEASGDLHAAKLVEMLATRLTEASFFGIGGSALKAAGVRLIYPSRRLAVVGITEVIRKLPDLVRGWRIASRHLRLEHPDLLVLVDFPDFNLRLAAVASRLGVPVLYYISPQLWAWRQGRVRRIKKHVDHMAVILPFEAAFYRRHNIPVTFVGHPLLDQPTAAKEAGPEIAGPAKNRAAPTICLLPGSRPAEIRRHLPIMLEAATRLAAEFRELHFVIAPAPETDQALVAAMCAPYRDRINFSLVFQGARGIMAGSHLAVAVSGTVTLEAALAGLPMVIIYKVSRLSYVLGKALIRVRHIGLINLIADTTIVPELIQDQATPENIAAHLSLLLKNDDRRESIRRNLLAAADRLGTPGAAAQTAAIACSLIQPALSC